MNIDIKKTMLVIIIADAKIPPSESRNLLFVSNAMIMTKITFTRNNGETREMERISNLKMLIDKKIS